MDRDTVIGIVLLVVSLCSILALTLWSRRLIDRIAAREAKTAREILKELGNGR